MTYLPVFRASALQDQFRAETFSGEPQPATLVILDRARRDEARPARAPCGNGGTRAPFDARDKVEKSEVDRVQRWPEGEPVLKP